jgi:hypothetical protein
MFLDGKKKRFFFHIIFIKRWWKTHYLYACSRDLDVVENNRKEKWQEQEYKIFKKIR